MKLRSVALSMILQWSLVLALIVAGAAISTARTSATSASAEADGVGVTYNECDSDPED